MGSPFLLLKQFDTRMSGGLKFRSEYKSWYRLWISYVEKLTFEPHQFTFQNFEFHEPNSTYTTSIHIDMAADTVPVTVQFSYVSI